MARTQAELHKATLQHLGILDAVEIVSAEDAKLLEERYDDLVEDWRDDGLVYWPKEAIPGPVFPWLVMLLGNYVSPSFGLQFSPDVEAYGRRQLRRIVSKRPSGEPVKSDYF